MLAEAIQCGLTFGKFLKDDPELEQAVLAELDGVYPADGALIVNDELHQTWLWAITGMSVREPTRVLIDSKDDLSVTPIEHPSVGEQGKSGLVSIWRSPRRPMSLFVALVACICLMIGLGWVLTQSVAPLAVVKDPMDYVLNIPLFIERNFSFSRWQLTWFFRENGIQGFAPFWAPRWAIWLDFIFIVCYAYSLAYLVSHAFASAAGLRTTTSRLPKLLPVLGRALPLMIISDVLENIATLLTIESSTLLYPTWAFVFGMVMSCASLAKWVGFAGVVWLLIFGFWKHSNLMKTGH
jgi:hypothetical protein